MLIWEDHKIVAHDLETSGEITHTDIDTKRPASAYALQPWRLQQGKGWITSASTIRWTPQGLKRDLSQLFPSKELLLERLQHYHDHGEIVLGWNICFDISWLMALGPEFEALCLKIKWLDGMLLWRHLDIEPEYEFQSARHKKKSYRLKPDAMQQWLPHVPLHNENIDFHATDPENLARLQTYNDLDNVYTWLISKMIWDKLSPQQRQAAVVEAESLPMVAQANLHGIYADRLVVDHLSAKLEIDAADRLAELAPYGMREDIVRSPIKLANLMFNPSNPSAEEVCAGTTPGWQLPVIKKNKSKVEGKDDSRCTDKEVLHELAFLDDRVGKIKAYREALNAKGKFCRSVVNAIDYNGTGKTHPTARIFSTYTGRMTVSSTQGRGKDACQIGWALHQMKREEEFREIVSTEPGFDIVEFDAAGQEFRWMAIASGDPTMLNLCLPGEDAHSYMGASIVGTPYKKLMLDFAGGDKGAKNNRYLGKFANLSLQYRTSPRKLRTKARVDYNIPIEMPEAMRIHTIYQKTYPGVPTYWERQIALVKQLGYVETFGGRRINVVGDWNGTYGWSMGSTAINARIQGTGACQKYLAMMVIKDYLREIGGRFLFDLHDGLYLLIPTAVRYRACLHIKKLLDNLPYKEAWGFTPPVPMPWDCKAGVAWGRLKEVHFD